MANPTVLFIGLDSADPTLLDRWAAAGDLPALAELASHAARVDVAIPEGFSNGCAWPSLYTGVNPGRHGRFSSATWLPGSYDYGIPFDEDRHLRADPFWVSLSDQGMRVGIVDMVRAPLTPALNGFQVADWLTHDRRNAALRSTPRELADEILQTYGGDTLGPEPEAFLQHHDLAAFCDALFARIDAKAKQTVDFMRRFDCDLYMTVFGEPHDAGHMLWQFHDRSHPEYDPGQAAALGEPLKRVYGSMDTALAQILDQVEADYTLVFAGPGMGPNYTANSVLRGVLAAIEKDLSEASAPTDSRQGPWLRSIARSLVPRAVRRSARNALPRAAGRAWDVGNMRTIRFFRMSHTGLAGAIRINLRGREPAGSVEPGAEYEQLCGELEARLMGLINAETGGPAVSKVVRVHANCSGPALDQLPDLMVVWDRSAPLRRVLLPGHGEFETRQPHRRGDHNPDAVMYAAGPGIVPGTHVSKARVEDVAPTIGALLGLERAGFDGHAIAEITAAL